MPLQLLLGASGTGKTKLLYEKLIASAAARPSLRHIALVPEQFTMETQRRLVTMTPNHAILNIDILSFERLAYRVFEEQNLEEWQILDDIGKNMLLRRVAGKKKKELLVFQKNLGRAGFISRMKSMLSELYQYGVGEEELTEMMERVKDQPLLNRKLSDILVFYRAFAEEMGQRTIPAEELLLILAKTLPRSKFLKGAVVAMDGFTGFTPVQYQIVAEMLRQCGLVTMAFTLPEGVPLEPIEEFELFSVSKTSVKRLKETAKNVREPVELFYAPCPKTGPVRFDGQPALAHLERYLYRYGSGSVWQGRPEGISLHLAQNPRSESELAAQEIRRLVQEEGLRYREIAVVTGDLPGYRPYLTKELEQAEIPYFMDTKKGLMGNPMVELIRSALEAVEKNFPYEPVFGYLRTGLSLLSQEETDLLDNYVHATGKRGASAWKKEWKESCRGLELLDFEEINRLREEAAAPLFRLKEKVKGTVREAVFGIRNFLQELSVPEKMAALAEGFEEKGNYRKAEEYERAPEYLEELFSKMEQLLGDEHLSFAEFGDVLDAGLSEVKLGSIPSCLDQVQVGDIERSRLTDIKALLFLGLNDGIVPSPGGAGGILSDEEREILGRETEALAPTAKKKAFMERFYLYSLMTKPSRFLWLSASKLSGSGEARQPSSVLGQLKRLFPDLLAVDEEKERRVFSRGSAREVLAAGAGHLREGEPEDWWVELYRLLRECGGEEERLEKVLDGCFFQYREGKLSQAAARAVYGDVLSGSVTRLERYAACAYAQFLTYGLRLSERAEYEFGGMDRGNFFHKALETFFHSLKEENLSPADVTEEKRKVLTNQCMESALASVNSGILSSSAKNAYYVDRWKRITDRTIWALCEQWKGGDFRPEAAELAFDGRQASVMSWELPDDAQMYLRGLVDRLDICEDGDKLYVKVVDYKTGHTTLDLNGIYYGLQMQLAVYLDAVLEMEQRKHPGKKIVPAGVYYYHIEEPLIDGGGVWSEEELNAKRKKALQLSGLTNGGDDALAHMEEVSGDRISEEQFACLRRFVRKKVKEFGSAILKGDITVAPYRRKKDSACDFCAFASVCGFDPKLPGYRTRRLKEQKASDIWSRIEEEPSGAEEQKGKEGE
ncbi:PD-(D/E)XK nuclease family protein [Cuneatibacter sp. NSJ-177]|uniref:PD-(D/E)XK nuclease family protein n=1 Tax=Cuneatibacter sp. NSJ-177 TaxID=2931401 RepID=UPI001FD335B3|nr:PD-(D/E)XK nuclease family protein [Cuneatibacter sp. NSJ-177]MCJ7836296.1 PD-(D/E)XK nuclease family protein [Cuneatibacter sp. NSJ-177]